MKQSLINRRGICANLSMKPHH